MAAEGAKAAIVERVLEGIESGTTLAELCRTERIGRRTFYDWLEADEEMAARFARARVIGFDAIAEQALVIADTPVEGERTKIDDDGKEETTREDMLGHRKLQVDTRLKLLAKWDPKRYGERIQTAQTDVEGNDVAPADPSTAIASILSAARQRRNACGSDLA